MKTTLSLLTLAAILLAAATVPAPAQQKLAQTGMKFLAVGTDARFSALANGVTAVESGQATAVFYNPAGMARLDLVAQAAVGYTQWIADINHYYGSVAISPAGGDIGTFAVFYQYVDYGTVIGTILANNDRGYLDSRDVPGLDVKPSGSTLGLGYARAISDKFSIGGNLKYVTQDLGEATVKYSNGEATKYGNSVGVLAFDLGLIYRTGFRSLNLGMAVRNFAREVRYASENFQLPLLFKLGVAADMVEMVEGEKGESSVLVTVDAEHPRDYQEQIRFGTEFVWHNTLAFRIGYVTGLEEEGISMGLGLHTVLGDAPFGLDYAYTPVGPLGNVHRFTFQFAMPR
jgi:hypothetical protein